MSFVDDIWLGATATSRNMQHAMSFGTAFYGTATVQAWKLGVEAPLAFWSAMARAETVGESAAPPDAGQSAIDPLTELSGVGAKLAEALHAAGITRFEQIAALDAAAIDAFNAQQPGFKALAKRFDLVAQAAARV